METIQANGSRRTLGNLALVVALCVFIAAVLLNLFRWTLVEHLTPFVEPSVEWAVGVAFLASVTLSIIYSIKMRGRLSKPLWPLLINVATMLIVIFVPFTMLTTQFDFRLHHRNRMAVVADVLSGRYDNRVERKGTRGDLIKLPSDFAYLSTGGGEIVRLARPNGTLILFFDYRGILDSFSGFVYSADDTPPASGDFGGNFFEVERLQKNWFWASSRN